MPTLNRDMIIMALVVAIGSTFLVMAGLLGPQGQMIRQDTGQILLGLGLIGWVYSGITALEAASRRAIAEAGIALVAVVAIAGLGLQAF